MAKKITQKQINKLYSGLGLARFKFDKSLSNQEKRQLKNKYKAKIVNTILKGQKKNIDAYLSQIEKTGNLSFKTTGHTNIKNIVPQVTKNKTLKLNKISNNNKQTKTTLSEIQSYRVPESRAITFKRLNQNKNVPPEAQEKWLRLSGTISLLLLNFTNTDRLLHSFIIASTGSISGYEPDNSNIENIDTGTLALKAQLNTAISLFNSIEKYIPKRAINATIELFNKLDNEINAREQVINKYEDKPEEKDRFIYEINNISKRVIDYLKSRMTIINTYITKDYANEIKGNIKGTHWDD